MEVIEIDMNTSSDEGDDVTYVKECFVPKGGNRVTDILPSTVLSPANKLTLYPFATADRSKRSSSDSKLSRGEQILKRFRKEDKALQPTTVTAKREGVFSPADALRRIDTEATEEMDVPPGTLLVSLMLHQRLALCWMVKRERGGHVVRGGILADDQGLGKTITALALVVTNTTRGAAADDDISICEEDDSLDKWHGGTLIVCPSSVLQQWKTEICSRVHPSSEVSVFVHHGKEKARKAAALCQDTVVLTTYASLTRETMKPPESSRRGKCQRVCWGPLYDVHWFRVILDESQCIKNRKTACAQAAMKLSADYRWCMSGTPIQNSLDDLFPLFKFLRYQPYSRYAQFTRLVSRPSELGSASAEHRLREALSGLLLRRTKTCTIQGMPIVQLPEKSVSLVKAAMSKKEHEMYKAIENNTYAVYRKMRYSQKHAYFTYLVMILRLRQASSHPWLLKGTEHWRHSEVMDEQLEAAKALRPEQRQLLLQQVISSQDICPFCQDVPDLPAISPCGHVFCHQCFTMEAEKGLESDGPDPTCPHCEHKLRVNHCFTAACLRNADDEVVPMEVQADGTQWESSAKVDRLMEILEAIRAQEGQRFEDTRDKVLVFSQWTAMLDIVEIPLEQHGFRFLRLDGTMSIGTRSAVLQEFATNPDATVLLMSLRATSLGINLSCANHVILLDLWWNPAVEEQAIDRVHRIGQTKRVSVTRITVKDTVDERILELQKRKLAIMQKTVRSQGDVHVSRQLTMDDIHFLFDGIQ